MACGPEPRAPETQPAIVTHPQKTSVKASAPATVTDTQTTSVKASAPTTVTDTQTTSVEATNTLPAGTQQIITLTFAYHLHH